MATVCENCVEIWQCFLEASDDTVSKHYQVLSQAEQNRANRFRFDKHRKQFIIAHGFLRDILSQSLNQQPETITFIENDYGKPIIASANPKSMQFNLSHSENIALVAVTYGRSVGVDVEYLNRRQPDYMNLAKRFFSEQEVVTLNKLPADKQLRGFFNAWTRKEAFIKAIGQGLSYPLERFDVSLTPGEPAELLRIDDDALALTQWSMRAFEPTKDYVAAVVVEGESIALTQHHYQKSDEAN